MNEARIKAALNLRDLDDQYDQYVLLIYACGANPVEVLYHDRYKAQLAMFRLKNDAYILPDGTVKGEVPRAQPNLRVARPMNFGATIAAPQATNEPARTKPARTPGILEGILARTAHSPMGVLPQALAGLLDQVVEGQREIYPSPNEMYRTDPLFRGWVDEKIKYYLSNGFIGERNSGHLVNLIRSYERGGWLSYREETAEPVHNPQAEDSPL